MPRSVFLGRAAPKRGEPLWLEDDRAWAIALQRVEADECSGCGQPRSQTFDPALAESWTVDTLPNCAGCYARAAKAGHETPGPLYRVRRRDGS